MKRFSWTIVSAGVLLVPGAGRADSIWQRREPRSAYLFVDERARRVGDVLTVQIQEETDIGHKDQRNLSKDSNASAVFTFKGSTTGGKSSRSGTFDFEPSGSSQRGFDGSSAYTVGRTFVDTMSVMVIDVFPNGNLVVEGFRRQTVSGDVRMMRVSGVVRPDDISLTNVVLSPSITNLQIEYIGNGPEMRFVNQGYLGKLMNFVWPF